MQESSLKEDFGRAQPSNVCSESTETIELKKIKIKELQQNQEMLS